MNGPRRAWTWSRVDGHITQVYVRPSQQSGCWIEDRPSGWTQYPDYFLCDTLDGAAQQARGHFQQIITEARAAIARINERARDQQAGEGRGE